MMLRCNQLSRAICILLIIAGMSGCKSYYLVTTGREPVYVAEHGDVVPLYQWEAWSKPSIYSPITGAHEMTALMHSQHLNMPSNAIREVMHEIPNEFVISRYHGENEIDNTLREQLFRTMLPDMDVNRYIQWVLSLDPVVVAITGSSLESQYEGIPSWARMYNPPSRFIEGRDKHIEVMQYIVLSPSGPRLVTLKNATTLGNLLESQPWRAANENPPFPK